VSACDSNLGGPGTGPDVVRERELTAQIARLRALGAPAPPAVPVAVAGPGLSVPRMRSVLAEVREQLGMDVAWLSEMTEEEQIFRALDALPGLVPPGTGVGDALPRRQTVCHRMLSGEVGELVADAAADPALAGLDAVRDGWLGAYVGVPVQLEGRTWGTLCAISRHPLTGIGERDVAFLRVIANLVGEQLLDDRRRVHEERSHGELTAVTALFSAVEARDQQLAAEARSVLELATSVALELGLGDRELDAIQQVALLHDLGKLAVPDAILHKPGPLSDREWELMREHPAVGAQVAAGVPALAHLADTIRAGHERWDGSGYPDGRLGGDTPRVARIVFTCHAYRAMTSRRPYRPALPPGAARAELRRHAGTQFDPEVTAALLGVIGDEAAPALA
jgi:HD-GYP domain-containing protein (c-di-GMP phosphodiesterase class II)